MMDVIDWPQEKIDALLKEYSETEDIDVTLQNMGKRIEELEQELAKTNNNYFLLAKQHIRESERFEKDNTLLKKRMAESYELLSGFDWETEDKRCFIWTSEGQEVFRLLGGEK